MYFAAHVWELCLCFWRAHPKTDAIPYMALRNIEMLHCVFCLKAAIHVTTTKHHQTKSFFFKGILATPPKATPPKK